ncbi:Holliday junction DNA helicase RuvA [gamma proteobacterium BDW918]|jgi:holliday junction DNA helicase RuvA|uniref:Holliday junction branch migration complex subunit RuvA n=1 Tax=Zhongshania aliphaticivorans TaxID=1470434 RepID=A0A127M3M2_9GAMM|nr:Holliday junction branch migration protein RuvA [Zhongshania aliphaticivorans]AMO67807.1 Holliday junction ATP-dependent DNA helicase RuvA [Zhongshania aliphaticivorans]EIF44835.1 Holliday junction DNA helicase RuvA [gamma proteobacterium BDW918]|tara:strand:- start:4747 stop:5346 length:600 start_codon:yes stop_codon:yes gene_type:complete
MIGRLRGVLIEKQAPEIVIDVQGVGYEVLVPMTTLYNLPALGEEVALYTQFIVREDAQQLFGFSDVRARRLFRDLIKVNGVGPKMALAIMSGIDSDEFVRCVQDGNTAALVRLPGVGKKTAERLVIEMRDRLKDWAPEFGSVSMPTPQALGRANIAEAEAALVALGYKPQEASKAISALKLDDASSEELIRAALKNMIK